VDLMSNAHAPPGAHLDEVYPMLPFHPISGEGVMLKDAAGRSVLDLYGGHAVAALGYGHPRLTAALVEQTQRLCFQSNAIPLRIRDEAAQALAEFAPAGLDRVFFVNSGAEANENALRLALKLTQRRKVVAVEHSFHGRTAAAAAVTWGAASSWYGFPRLPFDVVFVKRGDSADLRAQVDRDTAAVIVEPVQGVAGAYELGQGFLQAAREACSANGALLILDEVQTGMGRLGAPFGAQLYDVQPDFLTTAKALGGGFPCGALILPHAIARELKPGALGTTFGGGPLASAAIKTVIDVIRDEDLLANVGRISELIRAKCVRGPVTAVQGRGFLIGLRTGPRAAKVRDVLLERNILTGTSADPHVVRLLPPLTLQPEHVECLVEALEDFPDDALQ
jgi:acetylornithine/N-succinyldiaminopimelate aminotransferase